MVTCDFIMSARWQIFSSQEQMDPWSDCNGFKGSRQPVQWGGKLQEARWKLELGCSSFASTTWKIKQWKQGAGTALGWSLHRLQHQGVQPWFAWRTLLLSQWWCSPCSARLHAWQVTLHLVLLYKATFIGVGEMKKKGFHWAFLSILLYKRCF